MNDIYLSLKNIDIFIFADDTTPYSYDNIL